MGHDDRWEIATEARLSFWGEGVRVGIVPPLEGPDAGSVGEHTGPSSGPSSYSFYSLGGIRLVALCVDPVERVLFCLERSIGLDEIAPEALHIYVPINLDNDDHGSLLGVLQLCPRPATPSTGRGRSVALSLEATTSGWPPRSWPPAPGLDQQAQPSGSARA